MTIVKLEEMAKKMIGKIDMDEMEIKDLREFLESAKESDTTDYIKLFNDFPNLFFKLLPAVASFDDLKYPASLINEIVSVTLEKMEKYGVKKFLSELSKPEITFFPGILVAGGGALDVIGEERAKEYREEAREIASVMFRVIDKTAMPFVDISNDPRVKEAFDELSAYLSVDFDVSELGFKFNIESDRDKETDRGVLLGWTMESDPKATLHWRVTTKGVFYLISNILARGGSIDEFFNLTAAGDIEFMEDDLPGAGLLPWFIDIGDLCGEIREIYVEEK